MSFELSQTPTLEAVATSDDELLAQDMQARVAEATKQAEVVPDVAAAMEGARNAATQLARLRGAERALHRIAKEARERLELAGQAALDALVEMAASGSKPDWKRATEAAAIETQIRYAGRAIERLAEHSIPLAQITGLREEAHSLEAQARAFEAIAQERAEKVLGQIRAAVSDEMVLPVDMSKGVAGALLNRAKDLRTRAVQMSTEADGLEKKYASRS
jgi:predicted nucleotidyltransferase